MPGKRASRARDYGLERTDNDMPFTSWPQVNMVNQKNYYTEYLKRDEQLLAIRLQNEEARNRMVRAARDKDRALAHSAGNIDNSGDMEVDADDNVEGEETGDTTLESQSIGSKIIVIHPGSQNLRVGFASDVLPRTVPMVIARKSTTNESEDLDAQPRPKRRKVEGEPADAEHEFDEDFIEQFASMTADVKTRLKRKAIRSVPNAREQAIIYNKRTPAESIPEHNDLDHIEWTEIPADFASAPDYVAGQPALRIPDLSNPRYRLFWPLRYGVFNEKDYSNKNQLIRDFTIIIEEAIKNELGLQKKADWAQYSCVFVIPDLYERAYVTTVLDLLFRDFGFSRVCFIQESLAASFGAGYSTCVIVDIGAQKTSICCVDEGMCVENSRVNLRYGGADITEVFMKMMLLDSFPYTDLNLWRRHDFLLAEELKQSYCTLSVFALEKGSQQFEFHLRAFSQDTRHYRFKAFDEVILAPLGLFSPSIFDLSEKVAGRRKLISRSYDLYDGSPNDPLSSAQAQVLQSALENNEEPLAGTAGPSTTNGTAIPNPLPHRRLNETIESSDDVVKQSSVTPGQEDRETPQPARASTPAVGGDKESATEKAHPVQEMIKSAEARDRALPIMPLAQAIALSIEEGGKGDERKTRDFFGGILCTGGGVLTSNFYQFLEEELLLTQPRLKKEIIVSPPPREIDPQVLVWKGASVFGKLQGTNDTWISGLEHTMLNSRILTYKTIWNW